MSQAPKSQAREKLKAEYRTYLSRQRGLTQKTVYKYGTFVDRFLDFKFGENPDDLAQITAGDITDFLHHLTTRDQPLRDKTLAPILRSFFRFLFQTEKIQHNLALGIPSVAQKHGRRIPYHLTADQIDQLLEAVRQDKPALAAKRNYAMVLLMARLGLRSPEVMALQLEDIDWRNGEILIRGKGGFQDKAPLLHQIGQAIAEYIQQERKGTSRHLFVTHRSPYKPFQDAQILNGILKHALKRTTIPKPKQYTVSHMLRHSLATNLVQRGASLEEISNTLRHRSRQTTLLYARQDISGLRTIAQSWPIPQASQS